MKKILIGVIAGLAITSFAAGAAYIHYFTDVPEGKWYTESVEFLKQVGVVSGYSDGTFKPGKDVTRAEISVMLTQAMAEMGHEYAACIAKPYSTDIGSLNYPTANKYRSAGGLGAVFTAYDCGPERLEEFFDGPDAMYTWGSSLTLWEAPSPELYEALGTAGYVCEGTDGDEHTGCKVWLLENEAPISNLIPLREFTREFKRNDCINCG